MSNRLDPDCLHEAVEALQTCLDAVRASGLDNDERFRAYHLAQLEGDDGGWLGGPYLIDALRSALDGAEEDDAPPYVQQGVDPASLVEEVADGP